MELCLWYCKLDGEDWCVLFQKIRPILLGPLRRQRALAPPAELLRCHGPRDRAHVRHQTLHLLRLRDEWLQLLRRVPRAVPIPLPCVPEEALHRHRLQGRGLAVKDEGGMRRA